jgi:hypothetical protein
VIATFISMLIKVNKIALIKVPRSTNIIRIIISRRIA